MVELVTPKIEVRTQGDHGRFVVEPLESGFGITLGNAIRRVLLGSLTGAAITWVKVEEVQHEFSTIPCVKENTTDLLLNIKQIRLRALSDRPGKLVLGVAGEGKVTAGDIQPSADYEIANP
ncbi:MAG: DNA-directed RNA polymerase subunit alpha, partial [Chloroflexi bacterium]|nr:DNA-directed RNA polymerase subunit alpha [Chloroflexota bacterium]